jgi:hypothetical protein
VATIEGRALCQLTVQVMVPCYSTMWVVQVDHATRNIVSGNNRRACIVPGDNASEGVVLQYNLGGPSGPCK